MCNTHLYYVVEFNNSFKAGIYFEDTRLSKSPNAKRDRLSYYDTSKK